MTPAARLSTAIELLAEILRTPRPADGVVAEFLRARRYVGAKDRQAVQAHVWRVIRRRARLTWWAARLSVPLTARTLMLLDLVLGERLRGQDLADLFEGSRHAAPPPNGDERHWLRVVAPHPLEPPEMPEAVRVECPDWAEPGLRARFGEAFATELAALGAEAATDLRVNLLRAPDVPQTRARLAADGVATTRTALSPWGLRLAGRTPIAQHGAYRDGWIEIQDEGSQVLALLCDARPGQRVVDFCAGAGGKTLALAQMMLNKGTVIATDVLGGRLTRARDRLSRAGVDTVRVVPLESESDPWVKRHRGGFDRVLVDAPCSGVGTWRRNPDARWQRLGPDLAALVALQARILGSAARLVKPGGRLIYGTCSLLPAENEDQVAAFLAAHGAFRVLAAAAVLAEAGLTPDAIAAAGIGETMLLTPARHGTDGFFGVVLERSA